MTCDCSSAPKMLTTLQHQLTSCVLYVCFAAIGFFLVLCITPSARAQSCTLPDCFVNGTNEIQCISCPVGFGVEVKDREPMLCSNSPPRNTNCEPCIAGVNFSDTNDLGSQCSECLVCHSTKEVETKECTATSDRECTCSEQHYYNVGLKSCFLCTTCGEGYEETISCTPTVNRECGPRNVTTTLVPPPTNQTMSTSTVSTDPLDTGTSTKPKTDGKPLSTGVIVGIAFGVIGLIAIFVLVLVRIRLIKCPGDICTGGEGRGDSPLTLNCCIGVQTNKYNNSNAIPTVSTHGMNESNGNTQYHLVPIGPGVQPHGAIGGLPNGDVGRPPNGAIGGLPNGDVGRPPNGAIGGLPNGAIGGQPNRVVARQHSATSSTTEETEHQQSVEDALFSAEIRERVIRALDANDGLMRNAHMLASKNFSRGTYNLQATNTPASDVLDMWVERGKTKAALTAALRAMGRDDVADICEEDSAGS